MFLMMNHKEEFLCSLCALLETLVFLIHITLCNNDKFRWVQLNGWNFHKIKTFFVSVEQVSTRVHEHKVSHNDVNCLKVGLCSGRVPVLGGSKLPILGQIGPSVTTVF